LIAIVTRYSSIPRELHPDRKNFPDIHRLVDAASQRLIHSPGIASAASARRAQQTGASTAPQEMHMRVEALEQAHHSAGYGNALLERPDAAQSAGVPDLLLLALWSGIGLVMSMPFVPLLSKAMADDDTFNLLAGLLG
jgi:hypothetical protein